MKFYISRKVSLLAITITVVFGTLLWVYFVKSYTQALKFELDERASGILNNLSVNSEYPVLIRDKQTIARLGRGVLAQKDVVYCRIEGADGTVLFEEGDKNGQQTREYSSDIVTKKVEKDTS